MLRLSEILSFLLVLIIPTVSPAGGLPKRAAARQAVVHQSGTLNVNHTTLFYETFGTGTPILILHGGPGLDHTYFLPQLLRLSHRYKLIFFDERACGRSSADVDSSSMTMRTMVDDVDAVRVAFHLGRVNLLGHSWGGLLAMWYVLAHPENVKSLILVDPTPATSAWRDSSFAIMKRRRTIGDSARLAQFAASDAFNDSSAAALTAYFRLLFKPMFADTSLVDSLTLKFPADYATRMKALRHLNMDPTLRRYDLNEGLRDLRRQALIIAGDHDIVPLEAFEQIHRDLSGSRFVIIKNCGHFPFVEKPKEFDAAVESFLR